VKLVFYSGGSEDENCYLDREAFGLTGKCTPKITYIPACSYDGEMDFRRFVCHNRQFGTNRFLYFPIDIPYDEIMLREMLTSDIIHLSGGNTFYFLHHLRKTGLLDQLKYFVNRGGVLTGLSAGAILMTPSITAASYPEFDRDDNDEKVRNWRALGLVKFEFFPHYRNSRRYDQELCLQSKKTKLPIYALPDASGLIIEDDEMRILGKAWAFYQGQKTPLLR
jgi:dipeptidase E